MAIRLTGFRGDIIKYRGSRRLSAAGLLLREVRQVGNFEGSTLTFRFIPREIGQAARYSRAASAGFETE